MRFRMASVALVLATFLVGQSFAVAQESAPPPAGSPPPAAAPAPAATDPAATTTTTDPAAAPAAAPADPAAPTDPAAAPTDPAAPAAAPSSSDLATAEQEYELQVKDLEGKVNDLKEQIFRSKAKLTLLTQAVTEGGLGQGARVVIVHKNDMGSNFVLTEVNYFLDGAPLWQDVDEEGKRLTAMKKHIVWEGNIVEGAHTLNVQMTYRGDGSGVFSYIQGYTFNLKDTHTFSAEPGKVVLIESVGYEQGTVITELTDRPAMRFDTKLTVNEPKPSTEAAR